MCRGIGAVRRGIVAVCSVVVCRGIVAVCRGIVAVCSVMHWC